MAITCRAGFAEASFSSDLLKRADAVEAISASNRAATASRVPLSLKLIAAMFTMRHAVLARFVRCCSFVTALRATTTASVRASSPAPGCDGSSGSRPASFRRLSRARISSCFFRRLSMSSFGRRRHPRRASAFRVIDLLVQLPSALRCRGRRLVVMGASFCEIVASTMLCGGTLNRVIDDAQSGPLGAVLD